MWRKKILPYFQYTKKERTGILALVTIVLLLWIIPYFFSAGPTAADEADIQIINSSIDTLQVRNNEPRGYVERERRNFPLASNYSKPLKPYNLFPFDPNFTSVEEWEKLGVNPKTIKIIQNYLQKGGTFRKTEDLQKVYGLKQADYIRLKPFVRINSTNPAIHEKPTLEFRRNNNDKENSFVKEFKQPKEFTNVDINTAGPEIWEQFPGIGQKIAARILLFREKLGGFHSVEQVGETFGITPELFQEIKPRLVVPPNSELRKIDINSTGQNELKQHPYIGYKLAALIISYRDQHGPYNKTEELLQIPLFDAGKWPKLAPYLTTGRN